MSIEIVCNDVLHWAEKYEGPPFHTMLCDPPYELAFMGKSWDASGISFRPEAWAALAAHLLPGAFILAFASSRGWHRQAVAMEDAGLRMHPSIFLFGWLSGQSFPKSTRIDIAIDKKAGETQKEVGEPYRAGIQSRGREDMVQGAFATGLSEENKWIRHTIPITPLATAWAGHRYGGQILKNSLEPILCFQKPYGGKSVDMITKTGAGALNIDGARIGVDPIPSNRWKDDAHPFGGGAGNEYETAVSQRRWPANFLLLHLPECTQVGTKQVIGHKGYPGGPGGLWSHKYQETSEIAKSWNNTSTQRDNEPWGGYADADGLETVGVWECAEGCPVRLLDEQSGISHEHLRVLHHKSKSGFVGDGNGFETTTHADSGGASRFFFNADWSPDIAERLAAADPVRYCAKAGRREREAGLEGREEQMVYRMGHGHNEPDPKTQAFITHMRNNHPTVKPLSLCKYLATLLLPPVEYAPRRILVPFAGVMSEAIGAMLAGWEDVVAVEMDAEYCNIGRARVGWWAKNGTQQLSLLGEN